MYQSEEWRAHILHRLGYSRFGQYHWCIRVPTYVWSMWVILSITFVEVMYVVIYCRVIYCLLFTIAYILCRHIAYLWKKLILKYTNNKNIRHAVKFQHVKKPLNQLQWNFAGIIHGQRRVNIYELTCPRPQGPESRGKNYKNSPNFDNLVVEICKN